MMKRFLILVSISTCAATTGDVGSSAVLAGEVRCTGSAGGASGRGVEGQPSFGGGGGGGDAAAAVSPDVPPPPSAIRGRPTVLVGQPSIGGGTCQPPPGGGACQASPAGRDAAAAVSPDVPAPPIDIRGGAHGSVFNESVGIGSPTQEKVYPAPR